MLKIALVEDHAMVRQSFVNLIQLEPEWHVTAEFDSFKDTENSLRCLDADIILIDISLPDKNGLEVVDLVEKRRPDIKKLVVSMYEHFHYVSKAIELGSLGYLSKRAAAEEIIKAIETVARGDNYLSMEVAKSLLFNTKKSDSVLSKLTAREREIFALLAKGHNAKKIAQLTNTMPKTVLTHRTNIFRKTNVNTQFDLLKIALREGVIDLAELV